MLWRLAEEARFKGDPCGAGYVPGICEPLGLLMQETHLGVDTANANVVNSRYAIGTWMLRDPFVQYSLRKWFVRRGRGVLHLTEQTTRVTSKPRARAALGASAIVVSSCKADGAN